MISNLVIRYTQNEQGFSRIELSKRVIDIRKTFTCGQSFRWTPNNDGSFKGVVGNQLIYLMDATNRENIRDGRQILISTVPLSRVNELVEYLSLTADYSQLEKANLNDFERKALNTGNGIRILKQDLWEALVSFIISQRNNIPKIMGTVERLSIKAGTEHNFKLENRGIYTKFYEFPTAEQIIRIGKLGLDECGLGYRSEYVLNIAHCYLSNPEYFLKLKDKNISGDQAVEFLTQFKGIGPKVANCVALFGLNKLDMFPIDVWIQRAINTYYNGSIDIGRFESLAGLMQQYIFYYMKQSEV